METIAYYKLYLNNRNYGSWDIYDATTLSPVQLPDFNPASYKMFSNDVFSYESGKVTIIHSSVCNVDNIPGVLILSDNKTYGRKNGTSNNNSNNKLLYKCIPDDIRLPVFLVPYEIKQLGFSKVLTNLYVTFKFDKWDSKHPYGSLTQNIGSVSILDNFYEYQLYCKSLHASIQRFNKETNKAIQTCMSSSSHDEFIEECVSKKFPNIEDRTQANDYRIITIDPPTSSDFDDGFSLKRVDENTCILSIYIANVTIWMDALNLWQTFSRRISTIYLPDKKRPMLPTILSDCLCSLQEKSKRFALALDLTIDTNTYMIIDTKYTNCIIKVARNYSYESNELLSTQYYHELLGLVKNLSVNYKYISNVRNSHELVCYLMILMNYHCAQELLVCKKGIFRSTILKTQVSLPDDLPEDVSKFIKIWNSASGQYIDSEIVTDEEFSKLRRHELLEMDAYVHMTSPIRRLVDLLNFIKFQKEKNLITLSDESEVFYAKWLSEIDYINVTMRAIRKVQSDCSLLDMCYNNPDTLERLYDGYCFDKLQRNDGLYQFIIYIPELRLSSRITLRNNLENYEKRQYKLFLFSDEEKFKKKIRLQLVQN
uniref:RNB domain-containing protein n=1 Tax=viral metagenome TaxID=1070528 RepID=A0A6C0IR91_9ZZZZ